MSETTDPAPEQPAPVEDTQQPYARAELRQRLTTIKGSIESAKRRNQLGELADAIGDLAALLAEALD